MSTGRPRARRLNPADPWDVMIGDMIEENSRLRPFCRACGWRKGGPDSWNGKACKCGHSEPPMERVS
jgi:hypothetical protein